MRTVCGLRFTSLPGDAREQLSSWTKQSRMTAPAFQEPIRPAPPIILQREEASAPSARYSEAYAEPVFAIPPSNETYLSEPIERTPWQGSVFYWMMFGLLAAALTVAAYQYGIREGKSEIVSVERTATSAEAQASPQAPAPNTVPAPPITSDESQVPTGASAVPSETPAIAGGGASLPNAALLNASKTDGNSGNPEQHPARGTAANALEHHAEQAFVSGDSDLESALAYLHGVNGYRDSPKAVRLLWAAVANRNSKAEVVLADLYLRGDGVARSCEQGRVLLRAASKSGNVEADQKLHILIAHGCP